MAEYIEREAAIKLFNFAVLDCLGMEPTIRAGDIIKALESIPAADVAPVVRGKRGKWINQRADSEMCSACGVRFYISALFAVGGNDEPNFCPNCGADMRPQPPKEE